MILFKRPPERPLFFLRHGNMVRERQNEIEEKLKNWVNEPTFTAPPISMPPGGHRFEKEFENSLYSAFQGKCVFCESKFAENSHEQIELLFYRPYDYPVRRSVVGDPPYFWLRWQWPNMYLACSTCFKIYPKKGDLFLIKGRRAHPTICEELKELFDVGWLYEVEQPLFLDPCHDNPAEHIRYEFKDNSVELIGKTKRGEATIEALQLNRDTLVDARRTEANRFAHRFDVIWRLASDRKGVQIGIDELLSQCADDAPFAGMKRQLLDELLIQAADVSGYQLAEDGLWEKVTKQLSDWTTEKIEPPKPFPPVGLGFAVEKGSEIDKVQRPLPPKPEIRDENQLLPPSIHGQDEPYRRVLRVMFADYEKVIVKKEFGAGFSGARVFMVRPLITDTDAKLPVVVKIGTKRQIEKEWKAYDNYIEGRLANEQGIENKVFLPDFALGALRYKMAGGGVYQVDSLRNYVRLKSHNNEVIGANNRNTSAPVALNRTIYQLLDDHFNEQELKTLCFYLNLDYDNLPAQGKSNKARELVELCNRHGRLDELKDEVLKARPHIDWPTADQIPNSPIRLPRYKENIHSLFTKLFRSMRILWQNNSESKPEYSLRRYDSLLPVNLVVDCIETSDNSIELRPETLDNNSYPLGKTVAVSGFHVEEIGEKEITLNVQPKRVLTPYRIRLRSVPDKLGLRAGQRINQPITGIVQQTRASFLIEQVKRAFGSSLNYSLDEQTKSIEHPDGIPNPNPIFFLPQVLKKSFDVEVSSIHGDLNLENVLVEYDEERLTPDNIYLIDFANARKDHWIHDLLRLESGFWLYLVPEEMKRARYGLEILPEFFEAVQKQDQHPVTALTGMERALTTIQAIRAELKDTPLRRIDPKVWNLGLMIYLLAALKFRNLDEEVTAPLPKQIAFLVASLAYQQANPDWGK